MEPAIKTSYKLEKETKDLAIVKKFEKLMAQPGAMTTAVNQRIMEEFSIHATSTIWTIRKRVAKREAAKTATK